MPTASPCIACRGGRCVAHGVKRFTAYPGPVVNGPTDEDMVELGNCDCFAGVARMAAARGWQYCPVCGRAARDGGGG